MVAAPVLARHAYSRFDHPDVIVVGDRRLALVDDGGKLANGDTVLGWRGDPTLALTCTTRPTAGWHLVKAGPDGRYRIVKSFLAQYAPGGGLEVLGMFVRWLVEHDPRKGYDAVADVVAHNDRVEAAREAELAEYAAEEVAPRFVHALDGELGLDLDGRVWAAPDFTPAASAPEPGPAPAP